MSPLSFGNKENTMAIKKLGTIVNTFGLKGQVKVSVTTSQPEERFKVGSKVLIKSLSGEEEEFIVKSLMIKNSKIVILGFEGYDDINDIEWMKEREIFKNVRAPKGAYFFDDLVGMKVFTDQGEEVGEVTSITKMPAGDYLVIEKKIYISFLLEKFVESVDKKEKKIVLTALGTETTK